jgi:hypothetical protein
MHKVGIHRHTTLEGFTQERALVAHIKLDRILLIKDLKVVCRFVTTATKSMHLKRLMPK